MPRLAARVKPGPRHPPRWLTPEFPLRHGHRHSHSHSHSQSQSQSQSQSHSVGLGDGAGATERPGGPGERAGRGGRVERGRD